MNSIFVGLTFGFIIAGAFANFMHTDGRVLTLSFSILAIALAVLAAGSAV